MQEEDNREKLYKGGVLIVGSLLWDNKEIRKNWRQENLIEVEKTLLNLPIRYGRISKTRNCTYSMVFSSDSKSTEKIGKGYFIPFKSALSLNQIIEQGYKMIDAEHNEKKKLNRFHWYWGALGIVLNPDLENKNEVKEKFEALKKRWNSKFKNGFNSAEYAVGNEGSILPKAGYLDIDWQEELGDFDFVIGTATKPKIESYPTAKEIAMKMLVNKDDSYFKNNIKCSIKTFQDEDIILELGKELKLEKKQRLKEKKRELL